MNIQKFTQKSIEAVNGCDKIANEFGNQEIEQEHLLYSLLQIDDSLISRLIEKMGIDLSSFKGRVEQAIGKRPKVQGGRPYIGEYLNKVLVSAEDEAKAMGDEFVSVEHLFLCMLKNPNKEIRDNLESTEIHFLRFYQRLEEIERLIVTILRLPMIPWKNMVKNLFPRQDSRKWIRL